MLTDSGELVQIPTTSNHNFLAKLYSQYRWVFKTRLHASSSSQYILIKMNARAITEKLNTYQFFPFFGFLLLALSRTMSLRGERRLKRKKQKTKKLPLNETTVQ